MSNENAIEATRLALALQDARTRIASANIANASAPGATARRLSIAGPTASGASWMQLSQASMRNRLDALQQATAVDTGRSIQVDQEVGEMVAASTTYQTLTEALSRQFGLMRLAITGRS